MKNKSIKVLIDVSPLANSKKSGVGHYTDRLLDSLARNYPDLEITGYYFNFLGRKQVSLTDYPNVHYRCIKLFPSKILSIFRRLGIELPLELFVPQKFDVILFTNFVGFPKFRNTPAIDVIHDLGYIDCPQYLQGPNRRHLTRFVPRSLKRSERIIAVSEATKQSLIRHYDLSPDTILVTPIPPPTMTFNEVKPASVNGKYILYFSTIEPRKNFINLVRAYAELPQKIRDTYGLVLGGGAGWHVEKELAEIKELQEQGLNIVLPGYVTDEERAWIYKHASLFVQPSHYEGFGMTILEAMEAGLPTAVSDIPVFCEVCGDASVYFNKDDISSIAKTIETVLGDTELQKQLTKKGIAQVALFTWDSVANDVMGMITELTDKEQK